MLRQKLNLALKPNISAANPKFQLANQTFVCQTMIYYIKNIKIKE
jgi:hypothetical protein